MKKKMYVYVGTYTAPIRFGTGQILNGKGEGVYVFEMNPDTGELNHLQTCEAINPSYLVMNSSRTNLYAVNELKEYEGKPQGSASSFSISCETGRIAFLNKRGTVGTDPCHIELSPDERHVYVSNFMSGSVCVFDILEDGGISLPIQLIQHSGSSIDPVRQAGPHAHSLVFTPDGKSAVVPDLGIDKIMIYDVAERGRLKPSDPSCFSVRPGSGPRYCEFAGGFCFMINELDSTISVLEYDRNGSFAEVQCVSSLPGGAERSGNSCADIHIAGDFIYGSNRGHNSIVVYRKSHDTGLLSFAGCYSSCGAIPRNFTVDATGEFLICANQDSDNIVVFKIDRKTGGLEKRSEISVPTPVCVKSYLF